MNSASLLPVDHEVIDDWVLSPNLANHKPYSTIGHHQGPAYQQQQKLERSGPYQIMYQVLYTLSLNAVESGNPFFSDRQMT